MVMINDNGKRNEYDEMQMAQRGVIGNQMFKFLLFKIFVVSVLHYAGVSEIDFQTKITIACVVCAVIYIIRVIKAGAYVPPNFRTARSKGMIAAFVVFIASAAIIFASPPWLEGMETIPLMLILASVVYLSKNLVLGAVSKKIDRSEDKDI